MKSFNLSVLNIFITVSLFLCSLQSFYLSRLGGPLIPYLGGTLILLTALVHVALTSHTPRLGWKVIVVTLAFMCTAVLSFIFTHDGKGALGVIFGCCVFLSTITLMRGKVDALQTSLEIILSVHLLLLFIQVATYFSLGWYLDYLYFTDDQAAWKSSKSWIIAGQPIPRFTGAFNEPGSYSGVMGALLATYYHVRERAGLLFWLTWASLVASAALTGAILAAVILCAVLWSKYITLRGKLRLRFALIGIISAVAALVFIGYRFLDRLQYTGGNQDVALLNIAWLSSLDSLSVVGHTVSELPSFVSLEYFGLWMTTYVQFGVAGLLALTALTAPAILANFFVGATLLLAKMKITYPLIFCLLAVVWLKSEYINSLRLRLLIPNNA